MTADRLPGAPGAGGAPGRASERAPRGDASDGPDELVLQIDGGDGETPALLVISRPSHGHVRVREWSGETWNGIPDERRWPVGDLYARLDRAYRARRRITVEMYAIRAWLGGL